MGEILQCSISVRDIYVKMKQHIYFYQYIKTKEKSDQTKFYYILKDQKLLADKWVKTSGLKSSGKDW